MADHDLSIFEGARSCVRLALLVAPDLPAGARHVGLLMLEHTNRDDFVTAGVLRTWQAEATIAHQAGLHETNVRRARRMLRRSGVVTIFDKGGGGARETARYEFNLTWAGRVVAELNSRPRKPPASTKGAKTRPQANGTVISSSGSSSGGAKTLIGGSENARTGGAKTRPESSEVNHLSESSDGFRASRGATNKELMQFGDLVDKLLSLSIYRQANRETITNLLLEIRLEGTEHDELFGTSTSDDKRHEIIATALRRTHTFPEPRTAS